MKRELFGQTAAGEAVERIWLESGRLRAAILTYGGALAALEVPDKSGRPTDVVLGFDTLEDYEHQDKYIGALVGRYANRIGGSRFVLGGKEYRLYANDGKNHLHGGQRGFDKKVWQAREIPGGVALSLHSPHLEEGYPGALDVTVCYTLEEDVLSIGYEARSDRETFCNLTNHSYFNLAGQGSGPVGNQRLQLMASAYTPAGPDSIPTGEIAPVAGTPMDFRQPFLLGERIDEDFPALRYASGYDHNWVLDGPVGTLRPFCRAWSGETGILLEGETTMPGVQLYTANFLAGCPKGKGGAVYNNRDAFCLETQFFPDAPHHPNFLQPLLRPGEVWRHTTRFRLRAAEWPDHA